MAQVRIQCGEDEVNKDYKIELWTLREDKDIFHINVKG
jgi:hypothetical protein